MICEHCGRDIPDGSFFCEYCKAPCRLAGSHQASTSASGNDTRSIFSATSAKSAKENNRSDLDSQKQGKSTKSSKTKVKHKTKKQKAPKTKVKQRRAKKQKVKVKRSRTSGLLVLFAFLMFVAFIGTAGAFGLYLYRQHTAQPDVVSDSVVSSVSSRQDFSESSSDVSKQTSSSSSKVSSSSSTSSSSSASSDNSKAEENP